MLPPLNITHLLNTIAESYGDFVCKYKGGALLDEETVNKIETEHKDAPQSVRDWHYAYQSWRDRTKWALKEQSQKYGGVTESVDDDVAAINTGDSSVYLILAGHQAEGGYINSYHFAYPRDAEDTLKLDPAHASFARTSLREDKSVQDYISVVSKQFHFNKTCLPAHVRMNDKQFDAETGECVAYMLQQHIDSLCSSTDGGEHIRVRSIGMDSFNELERTGRINCSKLPAPQILRHWPDVFSEEADGKDSVPDEPGSRGKERDMGLDGSDAEWTQVTTGPLPGTNVSMSKFSDSEPRKEDKGNCLLM